MKIFITGSEGFIGSNLVEHFSKEHEIKGYDMRKGKDITNVEQLERAIRNFKPDWILHLAAQAFADASFDAPIDDCNINTVGTLNLLLIADAMKIPVVFFSSSAVYGYNDSKLTEDLPPEPISFYGVSKACAELYCRFFSTVFNDHIIVFRISSAYDGNRNVSINKICEKAVTEGEVTIVNNGEQSRDFININDIIQAIEIALKHELDPGIYNLGTGKDYSINEVVSFIEEDLGKKIKKSQIISPTLELNKNKISIEKIKAYGFKPTISFEEGLRNLLSKYKSEQEIEAVKV